MKNLVVLGVLLVSLVACGGGGDAPTPTNTQVDFNTFVIDEVNSRTEIGEPVDINETDFSFTEDETAFDSVL